MSKQKYYLKDGTEVVLAQTLNDGRFLIEIPVYDDIETLQDHKIDIVDKLYSKAPQPKVLKDIAEYEKTCDVAENLCKQLRRKIETLKKKTGDVL